jgi:protein-tyrosine kinase
MGKISEALDKAGYEAGVEQGKKQDVQLSPEIQQPSAGQLSVEAITTKKTGQASTLSGKWDERLFKATNDDIHLPEVMRVLRSRILYPKDGKAVPRTLMITSAIPKEGKSFITANLGISLAQGMDQHSLLVDCDLRRPSLAALFGIETGAGLVDYLRDNVELTQLIVGTAVQKLSLLPSGKPPVNPAELLSSSRMHALIEELSSRYNDRMVIFDSPPALVTAETGVLAGKVDAVILVVRQGGAGKADVQKLIDIIGTDRILGIVFNDRTANYFEKSVIKGYDTYYRTYP